MSNRKFTDEEIIKALELHSNKDVACLDKCPYAERHFCGSSMARDALALINRQKAEIERLQAVHADMTESLRLASEANKDMQAELADLREIVFMDRSEAIKAERKKLKAEAIKEFAENVKAIFECVLYFDDDVKECILNEIDELVKEMTEGQK